MSLCLYLCVLLAASLCTDAKVDTTTWQIAEGVRPVNTVALSSNLDGTTVVFTTPNETKMFAIGLDAPEYVWSFAPYHNPFDHMYAVGAPHEDRYDPGENDNLTEKAIDTVVLAEKLSPASVELFGLVSNASASSHSNEWYYIIQSASLKFSAHTGNALLTMSDNGHVAAALVETNGYDVLHVINTQLGDVLGRCYTRLGRTSSSSKAWSLSLNADGTLAAVALGSSVAVYNTTTCALFAPRINMGDVNASPATMCASGNFIIFGTHTIYLYQYSPLSHSYAFKWTFGNDSTEWTLQASAMSVNGGPQNPDGYLLSMAFNSTSSNKIMVMTVSMVTYKTYNVWTAEYIFPVHVMSLEMQFGYILCVANILGDLPNSSVVLMEYSSSEVLADMRHGELVDSAHMLVVPHLSHAAKKKSSAHQSKRRLQAPASGDVVYAAIGGQTFSDVTGYAIVYRFIVV